MLLERHSPVDVSPLKWTEVSTPEPGPHEIRIRVFACGICRTDLHVVEGELPTQKLPLIPGHQIVGFVDKLGAGSHRFKESDRVGIAWLRWTCGQCEFCKAGKENLCSKSQYTGYHADGGFAEYAIVHEDYAYTIPEIFSDVQAVPLLCAGIVGFRALQRSQLPHAGSIALFGFGSSAHIVMQVAKQRLCEVFVVTRDESHCEFARRMGANWVGKTADRIPHKVDSAIIFAPAGELVPQALAILKKGGTVSLAGIHMSNIPPLNYHEHLFFEKNIHSVAANTRNDGDQFLAEASLIPVRANIKTYTLQEANLALQDLKYDRISGTGVLLI